MKLITLNIEKDKHIDRVIRFLTLELPDVICLQEVTSQTFDILRKSFNWNGLYVPMTGLLKSTAKDQDWGIAVLSPPISIIVAQNYYDVFDEDYRMFKHERSERPRAAVLIVKVNGCNFPIATTHFTRAPNLI